MLIRYLNIINLTEIPTSIYKMGAPSVKLPLKSWFTLSTVVYTNVYIKNSSDNLTKSFMIHKIYGFQYMILKEIQIIFVSMISSIADQLIITYT